MLDNKKGHSLYKSLGFREIGIIRQGCFDSRSGDFQHVVYMDLLKDDWLSVKENIELGYE
ncbi:GNAT family N-acetyltransferase [Alkaliphilus pronyensis]|uniref:hypothetical protein n=1 Tax=Alkaliphilus pronyensis TaxID=1482732 RepID=UPI001FA99595|nr:hypothetical protein [Alkaliphilus pronyensis]